MTLQPSDFLPSTRFIAAVIITGVLVALIWDAIERYKNRNKALNYIPST